jgi:hypothetical protein
MGSYDGFWEMNEKAAELDDQHIANRGFYAVFGPNGIRMGDKTTEESSAVSCFMSQYRGLFGWEDYERKGYHVKFVNVAESKQELERLKKLLD